MAISPTIVRYGGVTFNNVMTRAYTQEPVKDQSGQSVIYHRHTIRIVGWVHAEPATTTYTTPQSTASASLGHRGIRWALMQPRQQFVMQCGADVLLTAAPMSTVNPQPPPSATTTTGIDVNNGPICTHFDITQLSANEVFQVEAEFEICKIECDGFGVSGNTSLVLCNSWSCVDDIDRNFMTRRTISGTLRTATSLVNPHAFRNFVMPPLQSGMRRESMQFVATEDGLNLQYTIVDQEVAFAPPKPATTWHMRHTEAVTREGTIGAIATVDLTLGGDRNVDKNQLISIAASIIEAKLTDKKNKTSRIILNYAITNEISDDSSLIHATCTARRTVDAGAGANPGMISAVQVGKLKPVSNDDLNQIQAITGQYDRNQSRGTRQGEIIESQGPISLVGAFSAFLQAACSNDHELYKQSLTIYPGTPTQGQTAPSMAVYTTTDLPADGSTSWANTEATDNVYTFYQMESTYERRGMKAHMPIAAGTGATGSLGSSDSSSSQPTAVVVTLAQWLTRRIIRMKAERVGSEPVFPSPAYTYSDQGVNYTLLDTTHMAAVPERDPDGNLVHREEREFVYAADRDPFQAGNYRLNLGINPNDSAGLYSRVFSNDYTGSV